MSLADYQPPTRSIPMGETTLTLRGLSLESMSTLVRTHMPDLEALFDLFGTEQAIKGADVATLATAIVSQAPGFAANVIALAANEPDATKQAESISGPKQIELLMEIGELTFQEVGGVKKAWETIAGLLGAEKVANIKGAMKRLTTQTP